ncbi:peptidoglycan-binding domain-containing protein, partial [Rheinheimera sp. A13L]|uniref:peptidoglycan-binding domain-containing protein n=1 Tax=Rheinheimera sp. A13L TaxID=506534 RepID=UPI00058FBB54
SYNSPAKTKPVASPSATSSVPNNRELILQIQRHLNLLGYAVGKVDGVVGTKTTQAIKGFQTSIGEEANGLPSHWLLERLKRAAKG